MGELVDGAWLTDGKEIAAARIGTTPTLFRSHLAAGRGDGREQGRLHLYVSHACPWAHRVLIARAFYGLEAEIGVSVVHWRLDKDGWRFGPPGSGYEDQLGGRALLREVYLASEPRSTCRVTVPVLWDGATSRIVSNDSADVLRFFTTELGSRKAGSSLYPERWREEIDAVSDRMQRDLNAAVYEAGFARDQGDYDDACRRVFSTLEWLDAKLTAQRFLVSDAVTECDVRAYPTLVRFDAIYHHHFRCNLRQVRDYGAVQSYLTRLRELPSFADTTFLTEARRHYYLSHRHLNPSGIIPVGPQHAAF